MNEYKDLFYFIFSLLGMTAIYLTNKSNSLNILKTEYNCVFY